MFEYLGYFVLTTFLSTIFAIAGLGSAIVLVPGFNMLGLSFDLSRASGLFVNTISTMTTSWINFRKRLFDREFVLHLVLSSMVMAWVGAKSSLMIDESVVKSVFAIMLIVIGSLMLFIRLQPTQQKSIDKKLLIASGAVGGFFSGFLGIGGGSIISPILILMGYDPKKIAIGISFVVPFSSIVAFSGYSLSIEIDYWLLGSIGVGAMLGGVLGNYLLHFKVSSSMIKKMIGIILYLLAIKILLG
jgi:uncharacterized protein